MLELLATRLPAVCSFRCITLEHPAVVGEHSSTPASLVTCFHDGDFLVEAFPVFVADFTKTCGEKVEMSVKQVNFKGHVTTHVAVGIDALLNNFFVVSRLAISLEISDDGFESYPCM